MIPYAEALRRISDLPIAPTAENIPLGQAIGRVLAADVHLDRDLPPFDRATMDGFAVALEGNRTTFPVIASVPAGQRFGQPVLPGQAVRIMTGAPCPPGTTVIPFEKTDQANRHGNLVVGLTDPRAPLPAVTITDTSALIPGRNIAWKGEDGRQGAVVLAAGTRLSPVTVSLAGMAGATRLWVWKRPRLGVIITGDEVGGGTDASITDSNGPFLEALAANLGLQATIGHASDDGVELRATMVWALEHAEVIVTTGGVSAGDRDLVPVLATSLGFTTIFHQVAIQPGKPVYLARRGDGKLLVGLPGNPVSVLTTAHLFLLPLLDRLQGSLAVPPLRLPLRDSTPTGKRDRFLPGRRDADGVSIIPWHGSGDLIAAASGDCLVVLPADQELTAGHLVEVIPYQGSVPAHHGLMTPR